ncbi:MAG: hypothetical protein Q8N59_01615 [bacterium]|nr:hypothetical protein [bacterium]
MNKFVKSFSKKRKFILTLLILGGVFFTFFFASAANLGDNDSFFVDSTYDSNGRASISATLMRISNNAYFYMEDEYWNSLFLSQKNANLDYLNRIIENFDNYTYSSLRYVFGSEWKPGIDEDNRMTILFTRLKPNAGGYFNSKDEIPVSFEATSNEREMLYVNVEQIANPLIDSFVAHEFQHLISWNNKERINNINDDIWFNEMRSEYAPTAAGYDSVYSGTNLEKRIDDFLANPFNSLTNWQNDRYDYPPVNVFGHYLAEQFGEDIFSKITTNNKVGIYSLEQALKEKGYNFTFSQVFNNWTIANYLNNGSLSDGRYGYKNPYLRGAINVSPINYSIVSASVINISQSIMDWAPYWYRFINKQDSGAVAKDLEIEFEGSVSGGNFNVIYFIEYESRPTLVSMLNLQNQKGILKIPNFKSEVDAVTIIISNQFKKSGFNGNDALTPFTLSVATTVFEGPVEEPQPQPEPNPNQMARPEDYGLKEGDLIRAQGDFDVFIINQYGYKRLFLNPVIFNMYGHLGGWKAIKTVTPQTRDAFITSNFYRYAVSSKVYYLEVTGGDTGIFRWVNMNAENFLNQGAKPEMIFEINKSELDWYPKGTDKTSLL